MIYDDEKPKIKVQNKKAFKSKETAWRNSEGNLSVQKIFTNFSLFISTFLAYIYVVIDIKNGVPLNEIHCIILLVSTFFGILYKEMSNRFWLKLSSFKIGPSGLEVELDNDEQPEKENNSE